MDVSARAANDTPEQCPACGWGVVLDSLDAAADGPCPHCGSLLWFVRKCRGGAVVLTFLPGLMAGEEAMGKVDQVRAAAASADRLVLNLSHMRFISSMFLGMLVVMHRELLAADRTAKLCGLHADAREVFRANKLDRLFEIHEDEPAAIGSF